jgi:hypothetical protein
MNDRSWIVEHVGPAAFEQLATGLAGSELHSVLLHVMKRRADARAPRDILAQYERDAFCAPATLDQRTAVAIDGHLLAAAAEFEAVELSPVAPLGVASAMAETDQNRVLSALRMTEIVADPTNVLALECARRVRGAPDARVHLATSQRVIRAQPVPKVKGFSRHFRIFVLASGGRETKDHGFTVESIVLHVRTMLAALRRLATQGYAFGAPRVQLATTTERRAIGDRVAAALGGDVGRGDLDHPYYSGGVRYQIWVTAPDGESLPLVDGGVFGWLATLASDRRAAFVATGAGAELIALRFGSS